MGISFDGHGEVKGRSVLAKINRGQDKRKPGRMLRDTGTKCIWLKLKAAAGTAPSGVCWDGLVAFQRPGHGCVRPQGGLGAWPCEFLCPGKCPTKQKWDISLGWERESCKYWQKSSSVLALVPQATLMPMFSCGSDGVQGYVNAAWLFPRGKMHSC